MKVTYDPQRLGGALELASRVAPTTKGNAWDNAAGILLTVKPDGTTIVEATDLDVSAHLEIPALQVEDFEEGVDEVRWRLSSLFLSNFVKKLSNTITMTHDPAKNALRLKSGRSKLSIHLMAEDSFPKLHVPPGTPPVDGASLAVMSERITWAADNGTAGGALTGLHADGENLVSCRHEGLAMIKYPMELKEPVTFQAKNLISLVKGHHDVKVSADSEMVFLWMSETDWVGARLIAAPYPEYRRLMRDDYSFTLQMHRPSIMGCLERMAIVAGQDRGDLPKVVMTVTSDTLNLKLDVMGVAESEETLPIEGGPDDPFTIGFSLNFLADAISSTVDEEFSLSLGTSTANRDGSLMSARVTDPSGWEAMLMPRRGS